MRKKYEVMPEESDDRMDFAFGELNEKMISELNPELVKIWDLARKIYYDERERIADDLEKASFKFDYYEGRNDDEI